jgi:hypothetical protein
MTKSARIRAILMDGPATSHEISLELDISRRLAQILMRVLVSIGHVHSVRTIPNPDRGPGGPRNVKLWELTPRGRYMAVQGREWQAAQ